MQTIPQALDKLSRSAFRSSFHLTKKDRAYLEAKGMDVMRAHAADFVRQRLAPAEPVNDGRQTPMSGHPVFKAMQQERIVGLLMAWLERQVAASPQQSDSSDAQNP